MKTKKQINRKRSLAMKKSWAERRNSPGRKLARERQASTKRIPKIGTIEVTQRVTDEAIIEARDAVCEIRETIRDLRTNQGLAHSVEVSKRLDGYRASMQQSLSALKQLIDMHVGAYEKRLAILEEQTLHDRVVALEEIVSSLSKKGK